MTQTDYGVALLVRYSSGKVLHHFHQCFGETAQSIIEGIKEVLPKDAQIIGSAVLIEGTFIGDPRVKTTHEDGTWTVSVDGKTIMTANTAQAAERACRFIQKQINDGSWDSLTELLERTT